MVFSRIIAFYKGRVGVQAARARSEQIDEALRQDAAIRRSEATFLILGRNTHAVLKSMKLSDATVASLPSQGRNGDRSKDTDPNPNTVLHSEPLLRTEIEPFENGKCHNSVRASTLEALGRFVVGLAFPSPGTQLDQPVLGYLREIDRILDPQYLPSDDDIMRLPQAFRPPSHGPSVFKSSQGSLSLSFVDIAGLSGERRKWIHMFEHVNSVVVMIDLADYDQRLDTAQPQSLLQHDIVLFDSIVNSRWFARSSFILIMTNYRLFKTKLETSPLSSWFADYDDKQDPTKAVEYIFLKFQDVAHLTGKIHSFVCELDLPSNGQAVRFAVDSLLEDSIIICYCFGSSSEVQREPKKPVYESLS